MSPSSILALLNAGQPGRSPEGTAMLAGHSPLAHRQTGRLGSGPALGPEDVAP
jgi:hypothetical protein